METAHLYRRMTLGFATRVTRKIVDRQLPRETSLVQELFILATRFLKLN